MKAVDSLTINKSNDNKHLEEEVKDLREKNENNEYMINSKLKERDDAINSLSDQVMALMKEIQWLKTNKIENM